MILTKITPNANGITGENHCGFRKKLDQPLTVYEFSIFEKKWDYSNMIYELFLYSEKVCPHKNIILAIFGIPK